MHTHSSYLCWVCVYQTLAASTQSVHSECICRSFITVLTMVIIPVLWMLRFCVRERERKSHMSSKSSSLSKKKIYCSVFLFWWIHTEALDFISLELNWWESTACRNLLRKCSCKISSVEQNPTFFYTNKIKNTLFWVLLRSTSYSSSCALLYIKVHVAFSALWKQCVFFYTQILFVEK